MNLLTDSLFPDYSSCKKDILPLSNIGFTRNGFSEDAIIEKYSGIYVEMGERDASARLLFSMLQPLKTPQGEHASSRISDIFKINATDWDYISGAMTSSNLVSSEFFCTRRLDNKQKASWTSFKNKFVSGKSNILSDSKPRLTNEELSIKYDVSDAERLYHNAIKRFNLETKGTNLNPLAPYRPSINPKSLANVISHTLQIFSKPKKDFISHVWRILCLQFEAFARDSVLLNDSCEIARYQQAIVNAAVEYFSLHHRDLFFVDGLPKDFDTFYDTSVLADDIFRGTFYSSSASRKRKPTKLWNLLYNLMRSGVYDLSAKLATCLKPAYQIIEKYFLGLNDGVLFNDIRIFATLNDAFVSDVYQTKNQHKLLIFSLLLNKDFPMGLSIVDDFADYTWYEVLRLKIHGKRSLLDMRKKLDFYYESFPYRSEKKVVFCEYALITGCFHDFLKTCATMEGLNAHFIHFALFLYLNKIIDVNAIPLLSSELGTAGKPNNSLQLQNYFFEYVVKLSRLSLEVAVEYIYLLRDVNSCLMKECFLAITDTNSSISAIFGNYFQNGTKSPGLVDNFSFDVVDIAKYVAVNKEKRGDFYQALRFYDISRNYSKVVELLNLLVCESLGYDLQDDFRRSVHSVAANISKRMETEKWDVFYRESNTLRFFLTFLEFHCMVKESLWVNAYNVITQCAIIPKVNAAIPNAKAMLLNMTNLVNNCIPGFLVSVMRTYCMICTLVRQKKINFQENKFKPEYVKIHAKVLLDFASNLSEVYLPKRFIQELLDLYGQLS